MNHRPLLASVFGLALCTSMLAAPPSREGGTQPATQPTTREGKGGGDDKLQVTHHELKLTDGSALKYDATAGTLALKDEAGKHRANFFFVAYRKEGVDPDELSKRPVTFVFNGGPGAAAVWLHLGAVGPKTISLDEHGIPKGPPHALVDNPHCWLDTTDLVFIDPVNTGYSRAAEGVKPEEFFGVQQDISAVGDFIRTYLTRYDRWGSPKFLAGESYGTTRAAGLSSFLLERYGIDLNGIVFISSVLDFQTLSEGGLNDVPYVCFLPSYTHVAAFHQKLEPALAKDLAQARTEVENWARTDYAAALARGDRLTGDERAAVVKRLARYTAMPEDFVDRSNLRIDPSNFRKQLLKDKRQVVGRFDGRVTGHDPELTSESAGFDPSFSYYLPAYTSTMSAYARRTLKFETDLPYESLSGRTQPWSFGREGRGYLDVAGSLASAMRQNPRMRVFFASGYEDLATPYFATDYTIDHMGLAPELRKNVTRSLYAGGHMMYHVHESLTKLHDDVARFIGRE